HRVRICFAHYFTSLLPRLPLSTHVTSISLHAVLPISAIRVASISTTARSWLMNRQANPCSRCSSVNSSSTGSPACSSATTWRWRSEEHTSELQSRLDLVCRLLLGKEQ